MCDSGLFNQEPPPETDALEGLPLAKEQQVILNCLSNYLDDLCIVLGGREVCVPLPPDWTPAERKQWVREAYARDGAPYDFDPEDLFIPDALNALMALERLKQRFAGEMPHYTLVVKDPSASWVRNYLDDKYDQFITEMASAPLGVVLRFQNGICVKWAPISLEEEINEDQ